MLTSKDIKTIFGSNTIPEIAYHIRELQSTVASKFPLTEEDLAPHTTTRPTKYPKWKHRIQAVLSELKEKGLVTHYPELEQYVFSPALYLMRLG